MSLQHKFCSLREWHWGIQGQASLPKPTQTESPRHHKTKQRENRKTIWPRQGPTCLPLHCEAHLKQQAPIGPWVARKPILGAALYGLCHSETDAVRSWREGNCLVVIYLFLLINKNVFIVFDETFWSIYTYFEGCAELVTCTASHVDSENVGKGSP